MPEAVPETLTSDKGYFSLLEIGRMQELSIKTVISDPHRDQRRLDKLSQTERQTLARARRTTSSKYGRAAAAQTRPAYRTQLCPCARCRRHAPRNLARAREPEQTPSDRRRLLQPFATPAPALWNWNAQAVGGFVWVNLERGPPLAPIDRPPARNGQCQVPHQTFRTSSRPRRNGGKAPFFDSLLVHGNDYSSLWRAGKAC